MNECIIDNLLVQSFSSRSFSNKMNILSNGRPMPRLNLRTEVKDGKRNYFRSFKFEWYQEISWLCGCSHLLKLFCWPCLLFGITTKNGDGFFRQGVTNMGNFQNLKSRHEKSVFHIQSMVAFVNFSKTRIETRISKAYQDEIEKHNEKVNENRYVLKCLIDATCFSARQEIAFRGHNEKADSDNKGNYVELLNLLAIRDEKLAFHLKNSTVFIGTSKTIQNELIECIGTVVRNEIKDEISKAMFVSIMLDETVDISKKSQLSTTIRYISESNQHYAVERFIKFSYVSNERTADGLYNHIKNFIEEFDFAEKLIAQTYDGAAVMAGNTTDYKNSSQINIIRHNSCIVTLIS